MKQNVVAGFWIRFITRVLDLSVVLVCVFPFIALMMEKHTTPWEHWEFKDDYLFYLFLLMFAIANVIMFIVVPLLTKGKTLFMWLFRIEIQFNSKNKIMTMIKREMFFSMFWVMTSLMIMVVINHTMSAKFFSTKQKEMVYTDWETVRRNIVISTSSIMLVTQFIFSISITVRKNKQGLHDKISDSKVVWKNKFITIEEKKQIHIKIKEIKNNPVDWI